jgi:hypothetical protein
MSVLVHERRAVLLELLAARFFFAGTVTPVQFWLGDSAHIYTMCADASHETIPGGCAAIECRGPNRLVFIVAVRDELKELI